MLKISQLVIQLIGKYVCVHIFQVAHKHETWFQSFNNFRYKRVIKLVIEPNNEGNTEKSKT